MNLIEESFQNKEEKKKKRLGRIILVAIVLVIIIIISIVAYLMYLQSQVLRLTIDGKSNEKLKQILVFEDDGTIYVPIKEIAPFFGYDAFNGEYSEKSEIQSKCYLQNSTDAVNFELGKNEIYKLDLTDSGADYEKLYMKNPVKAIGGVLYVSTEGLEKAIDISFQYDKDSNTITILTIPYLYNYYANQILDYGYVELSDVKVNQKTVLNNQLVVLKDRTKKQYGVISIDGTAILEPKYDNITYLPNTKDFLVETGGKVGIMSANRETKVQIMYDEIQLLDNDSGLYVVKQDNKYGVININGERKIYIENDQIGIDISKFTKNNIKNKYILADGLIPARKDKYWALYDLNGNQLTEYKYDSLGYLASNNRDAINLLVIPDYNVLVACKDKKYTLVNSLGQELFAIIADDIYMTIEKEQRKYHIAVNNQDIDAIEYLDKNGVKLNESNNSRTQQNTDSNNQQNDEDNTSNNQNNEEQNTASINQENEEQDKNNESDEQYQEQNDNGEEQTQQEE